MNNLSIKTKTVITQAVNFIDGDNIFCGAITSDNGKLSVNSVQNGYLYNLSYDNDFTIIPPQTETSYVEFIDDNGEICGNITGKDGGLFINDVLQGNGSNIQPSILSSGSMSVKDIQTTSLVIKDTNDIINGNISAKDGKLYVNGNAQNTVYGAYVTNGLQIYSPCIDSNGNTWLVGKFYVNKQSVSLYNKYNELIQTLEPNPDSNIINMYIAYISSDGYNNCWIAKIETKEIVDYLNGNAYQFSKIDSKGNFILSLAFFSTLKFYDKNGVLFGNLSGPVIASTFVVKYSPVGIYAPIDENVLDPNMWASKIVSVTASGLGNYTTHITIDKKDNIVITSTPNSLASTSVTIYDKKNDVIDTIDLSITPQAAFFMVKYASNGLKYDENLKRVSWSAYIKASSTVSSAVTSYQPIVINSSNDIIIVGRYRNSSSPTTQVKAFTYDGQIGLDLPFTGASSATLSDVFILGLNEDGLSAKSWRNTITSDNVSETSDFVALDSNDNIIVSTCSGGGVNNVNINNQDNTTAFSYSYSSQSICIVKYNSVGVPITFSTLRGTKFFIFSDVIGAPSNFDNYNGLLLDNDNNIILKGIYEGSSLSIFDNINTQIKQITKSGNISGISFVAKLDSDMQNFYLTTFGTGNVSATVSPFTGNTFPAFMKINSMNEIIVTGFYIGSNVVFYNNDNDTTPSLSFTNGTSKYNGFILKYDSSLNNCQVCRLINATVDVPVIPQLMTLDSEDSIISCVRYGLDATFTGDLQIFNFDNITDTPDTLLSNSGQSDLALIKISTNPTNSWNARIAGVNVNMSTYDTSELIAFSFINTDKYNNIYFTGLGDDSYSYYDSKDSAIFDVNFSGRTNFFARYPPKGY